MLIEKTAKNISEVFSLLDQFQDSRSWIFRGQQKYEWGLIPRIGRDNFKAKLERISELELFDSWKRYALHYLGKDPINNFDWLTLAQHYGLATRLLDWTKNPLIALFFLTEGKYNVDAALYCIEMLKGDLELSENPFDIDKFHIFLPRGLSARIVSQRSIFTISESPNTPLEKTLRRKIYKIRIPSTIILSLKEKLDYYGVNRFSIYQDLESLSQFLNEFLLATKDLYLIKKPFG